jgi:hypothetical protein
MEVGAELTKAERLRLAEQDMAYATTWISDSRRYICEQKRLLLTFLQLRAQASKDYAEALAMKDEPQPSQPMSDQGELFIGER